MKVTLSTLKEACSKLTVALDSDGINPITNALELYAEDGTPELSIKLTNLEYTVKVTIPLSVAEDFHTTVSADIFIKLISQLTTETVDLSISENVVVVTADGTYKLPILYVGEQMLTIPTLTIETETNTFKMPITNMQTISTYNSKELAKGVAVKPVQKMYYLDKEGCITFTSGACVTDFTLSEDVKMLLPGKIINLFKLFKEKEVTWTLGTRTVSGSVINMLSLTEKQLEVIALIPSDTALINSVPKDAIRTMATGEYPYTLYLNKQKLANAIERILLFMPRDMYSEPYGKFEFATDSISIYDRSKANVEQLSYGENSIIPDETKSIVLDFNDVRVVLDAIKDETVIFKFGNDTSVLIQRAGVTNIIPECVL